MAEIDRRQQSVTWNATQHGHDLKRWERPGNGKISRWTECKNCGVRLQVNGGRGGFDEYTYRQSNTACPKAVRPVNVVTTFG